MATSPKGNKRKNACSQLRRSPRPSRGLYNYRWRKVRNAWLAVYPECVECGMPGASKDMVVDHIVPHRGNPELFNDHGNLQTMCKTCHDKKTRAGL